MKIEELEKLLLWTQVGATIATVCLVIVFVRYIIKVTRKEDSNG